MAAGSNLANLSINIGFDEFINNMPNGYKRWIMNIDGLRGHHKPISFSSSICMNFLFIILSLSI